MELNSKEDIGIAIAMELAFIVRILDDPGREIPSAVETGVEEFWFTDDRCRAVWRAAQKMWAHSDGGSGIDPLAILEAAENVVKADPREFGGCEIGYGFYDFASTYAVSVGGVTSLVDSLRNAAMARRMRQAFAEADGILSEGGTSDDAVSSLSRRVSEIQSMRISAMDEGCYDLVMKNIQAWRHARHEVVDNHNANFVLGLPIPWLPLSKKIRGLQVGMHVIAARPSVGKTSFGMQIALSLVQAGYHVGFNSLDMPIQQLMKRPVASLAQVALESLDNGYGTDEMFSKVERAAESIRDWQEKGLFQLTQKFNVYDFSSWCAVKRAEGKLDVVFVDYIQKMNAGKKLVGEAAMKEVSSVTSTIAKRLGIPVVALAQLNRSNEKDGDGGEREPKISDIRESGSIEQDAFTIFLLYNDPGVKAAWRENPPKMMDVMCDNADFQGRSLKPVWVHLAKNQNGGTVNLPFVVYENTFTWYLGDEKAEKADKSVGVNANKFSRITPDGRFPEFERLMGVGGHLVGAQARTDGGQTVRGVQDEAQDRSAADGRGEDHAAEDGHVDDFSAIERDFDAPF